MVSPQGTSIAYDEVNKVRMDPQTSSSAMDSGKPNRFRGSGDSFPAPGLAFGQVALAAAEWDLRVTQNWEFSMLIENVTSSA